MNYAVVLVRNIQRPAVEHPLNVLPVGGLPEMILQSSGILEDLVTQNATANQRRRSSLLND